MFLCGKRREREGAGAKQLFGGQLLCSAQLVKMLPAKKRDLRELQASWAVKEALGSRAGILELRDEGNLRLTQGKAELSSPLLFPAKECRGANKDKSPRYMARVCN